MTYGFIYCIGNDYMPDIYKIGMTERSPMQRCRELSASTSAPWPFDILFYAEVEDPRVVEQQLHQIFADRRVSEGREFFKVDPRKVYSSLMSCAENMTVTNFGAGVMACLDFEEDKKNNASTTEVTA